MSKRKKGKAAKAKERKLRGGIGAPVTPKPVVRKPKVEVPAHLHPRLQTLYRPLLLSEDDVRTLLVLLREVDPKNRVIGDLKRLAQEFNDVALRYEELLKQEKALAYWEEDKSTMDKVAEAFGRVSKAKQREAAERIEALSPEQVKALINDALNHKNGTGGADEEG